MILERVTARNSLALVAHARYDTYRRDGHTEALHLRFERKFDNLPVRQD